MTRDREPETKPAALTQDAAPAELAVAEPKTAFTAAGAIPPVETAVTKPAPTASERAYGAGVQALQALLAKGTPEPEQVVALVDAHRDEHDAMLAIVESKLGGGYAQRVRDAMHLRASVARRELVAGDPGDPNGGYFVASQKEQGAKWSTAGGGFTGTANKNGLDSHVRVDEHDALHAHVGKDKTGTLAWEHDGKNEGELYGSVNGKSYEAGVRRTQDALGGQLTEGAHHKVAGGTTTDGVFGSYRSVDGHLTGTAEVGRVDNHLAESASASIQPLTGTTVSASVAHDAHGTTRSVGASYADSATHVDGNVVRTNDRTSLHLGGSEQLSHETSVSGHLEHVAPDHGAAQTTLGLAERTRSANVVHGVDLEAGHGERDYVKTGGSVEAKLGNDVYGGAWGSYQLEQGHHQSAQLGASLTFTPNEKTALTLAGVIDQNGALETRLQLDVFKSRVASVGDLADHKKDALVSLFVSYSTGSNRHMLDDRFGAPQVGTPDANQVMGGIRIKF